MYAVWRHVSMMPSFLIKRRENTILAWMALPHAICCLEYLSIHPSMRTKEQNGGTY
jgi:hypothetical protein